MSSLVLSRPSPDSYLTYLPLEEVIPSSILGHRRHAFSGVEVTCMATPRMMRRGAVSYEESDVTAQYIRFLGKGRNY